MAGVFPILAGGANVVGEVLVVLPDPVRAAGDPVFRPGVARHPTSTVILSALQPAATQLTIFAPATSAVRRIDVPPLGTSSITTLLELSPLPFGGDARALFAALGGVPTFYLGVPFALPPDDDLVAISSELGNVTSPGTAFIGAVFPDGVTRAPSGWIAIIDQIVGSSEACHTMLTPFANERRIIVVDHAGRLDHRNPTTSELRPVTFQIRLSGDADPTWERTLQPGEFDLEAIVAAQHLGSFDSLFAPPAGRQFEVRAFFGDDAIPVQSILELDAASFKDGYVAIPPSSTRATLHLQITDLDAWYPAPSTPRLIERYRTGSHFEPLIDGIPAFRRLVQDLDRAGHPGHGAQFAGWAFNHFTLDEQDGRDLVQIAEAIIAGQGDVRMLATKFLQDEENFDHFQTNIIKLIALLLVAPSFVAFFLGYTKKFSNDGTGFILSLFAPLLITSPLLALLSARIPEILDFLEPSGELLAPTNALVTGDPIAIHARNPVRVRDNPLPLPTIEFLPGFVRNFILDDVTDHVGVWHNKQQCVKFESAPGVTEYSVFLGGIDINRNRLDAPGHGRPELYHDIHCRLTGPIVRDAWDSFNERWDFDRVRANTTRTAIPAPEPAEVRARPERHIARVGRTYPGPNPDGNSTGLPFSPQGERSTYDTLLAAIRQARRCIYIEEQYFVYDGTTDPPNLSEGSYHAALLNAASHCERLVILMPAVADQPWGEARWRRLIAQLRDAWGSRMMVGVPHRRPRLDKATLVAGVGRTRLVHAIDPATTTFRLAPAVRVPKSPFWLWIDGEVMFLYDTRRIEVDGQQVMEVDVMRANAPNDATHWFATPRAHKENAPVTHARLGSIYVHAKCMMIDDIFVSIGSANLNRRGFFWDGEINAFAIPERLAAAPDNPARAMRTALWAEHAGIPPAMGAVLFADPVGGADALLRSPWLGNRFVPLDSVNLKAQFEIHDITLAAGDMDVFKTVLKLAGFMGEQVLEDARDNLWNSLADPTSFVDPHRLYEDL